MKRRRFLVYLIIIVFILSFVSVPAFAAPPSPNHTITVDGSGFDGTGEVAFDLLQDGQSVGSVSSFDGSSLVFSGLSGGTYSISITSVSDGYEASVSPSSVKLVGREKSESFTITLSGGVVEDTEPPVISLLGDNPYTLEGGDVYVEPGYEVTDNVDSPENITVEITGQIDNYTPGSYTLTYTATDSSGNSSIETRTVEVVDTTAPVITLIGSATLTITEGDTYTDEGATANDIVDGDITTDIVKTGEVDTTTAGTYYITYNVSDAAGNPAEEVIRTVTVEAAVVNPTIHYLALGDSIATGTTGISGTMYTYAYQFRDYLEGIYVDNLTYNNLAVDGDDAGELLYRLNNDDTYISEVEKADIITLSIGGNNIMDAARDSSFWEIDTTIAEAGTSAFETDYPNLIARIRELNADVEIISMTLYNPYNSANHPTGYSVDEELHDTGQHYIGRINYAISNISDVNYKVADVFTSFYAYGEIGKMGDITFFYPKYNWWTWWYVKLTRDPHPNQTGQDIIRDIFINAYESPLSYNTLDLKYLA